MKFLRYVRKIEKSEASRYALEGAAGVLTLVILGTFTLSAVETYLIKNGSLAAVISAVLVDLTNGDRASDNLGGLRVNPLLTAAAQAKADDMAAKGYFAHISPGGENSWHWFAQVGYTFIYAGENLAVDFSDSVDVERAWMNSPGHRSNILNKNFTEIGIATAEGEFEGRATTFVVQMFGTPAPARAQVASVQTLTSPIDATSPALATATTQPTTPRPPTPVVQPAPKPAPTAQIALTATTTASTTPVAVATSSPLALVSPTEVLGVSADSILPVNASWWEYLLVSPKTLLASAYAAFATLILVLLAYVTRFEFHKRHMHHVAAAVLLYVLMAGLFALANFVLFSQPVLAGLF